MGKLARQFAKIAPVGAVLLLSACVDMGTGEIHDPYEAQNREIHEFNKASDKALIRPLSQLYGTFVPPEVATTVNNFVTNLDMPNQAMNHLLQGDVDQAATTTARFVVNSTIGLAGLLDPASDVGLLAEPTGFGDTLGIWGVPTGAYAELPVLGPSTQRDAFGALADVFLDPLPYVADTATTVGVLTLKGVNLINDRYRYSDVIDVLLYESADSYTAQRLSYLQNRFFALDAEAALEDLEDPYDF